MTKAVSKMPAKKRRESSARFLAWRKGLLKKVAARKSDEDGAKAKRVCKACGHPGHAGYVCLQAHGSVLGDDDRWHDTKTCYCGGTA